MYCYAMERGRVDALLTQLNENEREMKLQRSEIARLRVMVDGPEVGLYSR